jgi:3-oxoacyl-[acyl-carrier protein] reductase
MGGLSLAESRPFTLHGRTALVTGAGRGVGRAIARALAAAGAAVAVNDVHRGRAEAVAEELAAAGSRSIGLGGDITVAAAVTELVRCAAEALGAVDILVNNAGNAGADRGFDTGRTPFWETGPEDWRPFLAVNLDGVMLASRVVLPGMVERRYGRIITVISDAGRVGEPFLVPYSAAKAGAAGFTRALAREAGRYGVTVNAVSLGSIRDPADLRRRDAETDAAQLRHYVVRRFGKPDDVAAAALFLASDEASWITGQTYPVNGGYSLNQ